jgi:hypothetical protein
MSDDCWICQETLKLSQPRRILGGQTGILVVGTFTRWLCWVHFCKQLNVVLEGCLLTGLAEAGLISSNLSKTGVVEKGMQSGVFFEPDRYSYIL